MSFANWNPAKVVLVVDLDDMLRHGDSQIGDGPPTRDMTGIRPAADLSERFDPARLPYCAEALEMIARWRGRGGRVALVTDANQDMADAVAGHLKLFEAAYGLAHGTELTGQCKARLLEDLFGPAGYCHLSHAPALSALNRVGADTAPAWPGAEADALRANPEGATDGAARPIAASADRLAERPASGDQPIPPDRQPARMRHRARITGIALVLSYVSFAVIASLANLASQRVVLALLPGGLLVALVVGTLLGLVVKYLLDRTWIFAGTRDGNAGEATTFVLYAATGVITTIIFWGYESAGWLIWHSHLAREAGAVLGLAIGYVVKYQLDRQFVFTPARPG